MEQECSEPIQEELLDVDSKGGNESVEKVFFMALFAGEVMRDKISKICSYFGASLYKFPESADDDYRLMEETVLGRLGLDREGNPVAAAGGDDDRGFGFGGAENFGGSAHATKKRRASGDPFMDQFAPY